MIVAVALILIVSLIILIQSTKTVTLQPPDTNASALKTSKYEVAPELSGIKGYINAEDGFQLKDVQGKVILIDFWTYSCINCIRTLPYLKAWDEKYRDKGLVIVGVHSPEFEFEKDYNNVQTAVSKNNIKYPVVLDNDFSTWRAYKNRFWPHKYLVDSDGFIRFDHIGEGGYEETERMIQELLLERDEKIRLETPVSTEINATEVDFSRIGTPEIYFGYEFSRQPLGNTETSRPGETVNFTLPQNISGNRAYLEGSWKSQNDHMELVSQSGKVVLRYKAKVVNIVAGQKANLSIKLDGDYLTEAQLGSDSKRIDNKSISIVEEMRLYNLVDDTGYFEKTVEITLEGKGFRIYTFTFG